MSDYTLTDTQLMLLSAASQREDHLITLPETLRGGALKAVTAKLLAHGLIAEVPVTLTQPALHRADDGQATGLKLTRAGFAAIGIEPEGAGPEDQDRPEDRPSPEQPRPARTTARDGSKRARVVELLSREAGASLDELVQATGWLPHSARAALTGLRQRGYTVSREAGEKGSVYRITGRPPAAHAPTGEPVAPEA